MIKFNRNTNIMTYDVDVVLENIKKENKSGKTHFVFDTNYSMVHFFNYFIESLEHDESRIEDLSLVTNFLQSKVANSPKDFNEAVDRSIGGLEKKNKIISPHEKEIIAYHEAGHAICGWYLEHAHPLLKVTIIPRGRTLGVSWSLPDRDKTSATKTEMLADLIVCLGGLLGEKLVFNEQTSGVSNDLEKATKIARAMVCSYGMSDLGPVASLAGDTAEGFSRLGPRLSDEVDSEIRQLILSRTKIAKEIVRSNHVPIKALALLLVEKETMLRDEWQFAKASVLAKLN